MDTLHHNPYQYERARQLLTEQMVEAYATNDKLTGNFYNELLRDLVFGTKNERAYVIY